MTYRKSTPGGAPVLDQDYGTTSEQKTQAEILFDRIGTGAYRAISRPKDAKVDRRLRQLIAEANMSGDYEVARIEELESRLQFAEENVKRLTAEVGKYNRWMSEIEAAAEDKIAEKDARIAQLEKAVLKAALREVEA